MSENTHQTNANEILLNPIVSANGNIPLVNFTIGSIDLHLQLTDKEAITLARHLVDTANAARADAFIVQWANEELNMPMDEAIRVLWMFRHWREVNEAKSDQIAQGKEEGEVC